MGTLVFAEVAEDAAVRIEDFGFGNEPHIMTFRINYRKIPGAGGVKGLHDLLHTLAESDTCGRSGHELIDEHTFVKIGAEHDIADLIKYHHSQQMSLR